MTVVITAPNGQVTRFVTQALSNGSGGWCWAAMPHRPIGDYQIEMQGTISPTTGAFTIFSAGTGGDGSILILPKYGRPGTTFLIGLAGFKPHEAARVYLYRFDRSSGLSNFVTSLPSIEVDEFGEAIDTLPTLPGDPEAQYSVTTGKSTQWTPENTFEVSAGAPLVDTSCRYLGGPSDESVPPSTPTTRPQGTAVVTPSTTVPPTIPPSITATNVSPSMPTERPEGTAAITPNGTAPPTAPPTEVPGTTVPSTDAPIPGPTAGNTPAPAAVREIPLQRSHAPPARVAGGVWLGSLRLPPKPSDQPWNRYLVVISRKQ